MNKAKVIEKVSGLSGVNMPDCEKVIDALENILNEELESSKGIGNALDKICKLMSLFRK